MGKKTVHIGAKKTFIYLFIGLRDSQIFNSLFIFLIYFLVFFNYLAIFFFPLYFGCFVVVVTIIFIFSVLLTLHPAPRLRVFGTPGKEKGLRGLESFLFVFTCRTNSRKASIFISRNICATYSQTWIKRTCIERSPGQSPENRFP